MTQNTKSRRKSALSQFAEQSIPTAFPTNLTFAADMIEGQKLRWMGAARLAVVLLDDLQWADELTLNFLALFHQGTWEARGVAILGAYRSEDEAEIARGCGSTFADIPVIDLPPLEEASLHDIIREMLGSDEPDQRFVRQLARRAQGNPFFVAELLRSAIAAEMLYRNDDGCWRVRSPWNETDEDLPLPASLHDLIVHRLDGLSPSARQVLEMVAVFGREVEADLLECAAKKVSRKKGTHAKKVSGTVLDKTVPDTFFADLRSWFVGHWIAPFGDNLKTCQRAIEAGQASEEVLYRCFSHASYVICLAASGAPLAEIIRAAEEHMGQIARRVLVAHFHCVLERQLARALAGLTKAPLSLSDNVFDEERDLAFVCRTNNSTQIGYYHVCRLKLHYYHGEAQQALANADQALAVLLSFKGTPGEIDLVFFRGLTLLRLAAESEGAARAGYLESARAARATLSRWAADCPANFEHKVWLLDGEIAHVEGHNADACRCYAEAARSADAFGFRQHAALALERAGWHYAGAGDDSAAEIAFREAFARYRSWGAVTLADSIPCSSSGHVRG